MKNLFYLFLVTSTCLFLPIGSNGCGGDWDERSFSLFFNPYDGGAIQSQKRSFLYNPYRYTFGYQEGSTFVSEKEQNLKEWAKTLELESDHALESVIYGNHILYLNELITAKKDGKPFTKISDSRHKHVFSKLYQHIDFLEYCLLIQDYSYNVNSHGDEWLYAYHVNKADPNKMKTNLERSKKLYESLDSRRGDKLSSIFKTRLAYHLVRAAHFNRDFELADRLFNTYAKQVIDDVETSIVQEWLAGIRGGMLSKLGRKDEAFLWFARKFNRGSSSIDQAYIDLKWLSNEVDTKQALAKAKTQQDLLDIYTAIAATSIELKSDFLNASISKIDNESTAFFMWYRELQKVEETYYHPKHCDYLKDRFDDYGDYLHQHPKEIQTNYANFKSLTYKLYSSAKSPLYKEHYTNALAYINLLDGNSSGASQYLNRPFTLEETKRQNLVLKLYKQTLVKTNLNQPQLNTLLDFHKRKKRDPYPHVDVVDYFIRDFIAPHFYFKQNDTLGAFILWQMTNSDVPEYFINYTLNTQEYSQLEDKLRQKKHPVLKWASKHNVDLKLTSDAQLHLFKYVRDENWLAAKKEYSKVRNSSHEFFSPFVMHYDGFYSPTSIDSSRPLLSVNEFFDLGTKLKEKTESNPTGQNHLNYGMYLFSTSFPGHNSISDNGSLSYNWRTNDAGEYYFEKFKTPNYWWDLTKSYPFRANKESIDFYYCFKAEDHLKKAFDLLKNDEARAMCCFLLARCYQSRCPEPEQTKNEYGYPDYAKKTYKGVKYDARELYEKQNPYLGQLKQDFSHTKTYEEAYSMCNNLRHFLD